MLTEDRRQALYEYAEEEAQRMDEIFDGGIVTGAATGAMQAGIGHAAARGIGHILNRRKMSGNEKERHAHTVRQMHKVDPEDLEKIDRGEDAAGAHSLGVKRASVVAGIAGALPPGLGMIAGPLVGTVHGTYHGAKMGLRASRLDALQALKDKDPKAYAKAREEMKKNKK